MTYAFIHPQALLRGEFQEDDTISVAAAAASPLAELQPPQAGDGRYRSGLVLKRVGAGQQAAEEQSANSNGNHA